MKQSAITEAARLLSQCSWGYEWNYGETVSEKVMQGRINEIEEFMRQVPMGLLEMSIIQNLERWKADLEIDMSDPKAIANFVASDLGYNILEDFEYSTVTFKISY
jgi:hypothetical protein